ncbi:CYTH domain-containing protein [Prochlorococcus marinus XMU1406]|uniref:CYTH domain-containing protein n=1 Tax=Prochlorococcus marinus TaxID=1219 RepID=UPI001ADC7050|nr:CYTH domain-containing protein [Prochlorococcus marinus]MBO8205614.1 CYTH domain-containing protein [Prochlorococcus marinus XMU1406]MCR8543286.1 CYTH domain-containing protein [Prochlorococcus marinus XMU1427]
MALEIERRFLIKNDSWKEFIIKKTYIEQGYLSNTLDGWIIRVRVSSKDSKITLKKHIKGFTNFEFEYSIPRRDSETIMSNLTSIIKKERYFLEVNKKSWIIDCFKENNYPLEIAEIELSNEEEDLFFPSFISKEITGLTHYSNFSLANNPFSEWKEDYLTTFKIN